MTRSESEPEAKTNGTNQVLRIRNTLLKKITTGSLACSIDYEEGSTRIKLLACPCGAYITPSKKLIILVNVFIEQNDFLSEDTPEIADATKEIIMVMLSSEIKGLSEYVDDIRMIPDEKPPTLENNDPTTMMIQTFQAIATTLKMIKEEEIIHNIEEDYKKNHTIILDYIQ